MSGVPFDDETERAIIVDLNRAFTSVDGVRCMSDDGEDHDCLRDELDKAAHALAAAYGIVLLSSGEVTP